MIELILSVCLINDQSCINNSNNWEKVKLQLIEENLTPYKLFHYGQFEAVKWIVEHPNYKLMSISTTKIKSTVKSSKA